jgi:CheY-like chemotaxis protein
MEAVRRYREYEAHEAEMTQLPLRRLPIIGMSANSNFATKKCALAAGMDSFLGKPFNLQELQPLINQICPAVRIF